MNCDIPPYYWAVMMIAADEGGKTQVLSKDQKQRNKQENLSDRGTDGGTDPCNG